MVQRVYSKCSLCGKVTMIKYQAGHSSFPIIYTCPSCLSEIRGYCKNDDEHVELHINFENAETISEIITPDYFLTASRELLTAHIKKYEEDDDFSPSPFIILSDVLYGLSDDSNWKRAMHFAEIDAPTYNKIFDYVQLWEHGQESLLADKLRPILPTNFFPLNNRLEIYRGLRTYYVQFVAGLLPANWKKIKILLKRYLKSIRKI